MFMSLQQTFKMFKSNNNQQPSELEFHTFEGLLHTEQPLPDATAAVSAEIYGEAVGLGDGPRVFN